MTTARKRAKRKALAERDGWRCALCGETIDPALTVENHPRAATIHHVRRLGRGGTHDLENLVLAHRECHEDHDNARRKEAA